MVKPTVDIGACIECCGCVEIVPEVFRFNESGGFIEVIEMDEYPEAEVNEAIKNCPEDCIYWED